MASQYAWYSPHKVEVPDGQRLMLALPLYKSVSVTWLLNMFGMDQSSVVGSVRTNGVYVTKAMQILIEAALDQSDWDRLVFMEHDMMVPQDAFARVASYTKPEYDIVGSVYFEHYPPHKAIVYGENHPPEEAGQPWKAVNLGPDVVAKLVERPAIYEVAAVGFGFTSIARHVFEKWDEATPMFSLDECSHDLFFCRKAKDQGFGIYVDSAICCEHLTEISVGFLHNQRAQAEDAMGRNWIDSLTLD
jgi:GT2 family glycosyltransferase